MRLARASILIGMSFLLAETAPAVVFQAPLKYDVLPEDRAAVEAGACMKPYGLEMDQAAAYDFNGKTWVNVRCKSHGAVDGQPMHYRVTCIREDGAWDCPFQVEHLRAKIGRKELFLSAPRERMSEAFGATRYLVRSGKFDLEAASMSDRTDVNGRTIYHVYVEPAGERAVRVQKHVQWLYVERTPDGDYREVAEAEAAGIAARIEEEVAARRTIYTYFDGHRTGDPRHFREAFLPTAHIEGNRDGKFVSWTLDEYCALFKGNPAEDEKRRRRTIELSDVTGDSAIAKATLDHGATVFTDYFVLLKVNGEWKIANKVYTARKK